jgi:hypothetical protein
MPDSMTSADTPSMSRPRHLPGRTIQDQVTKGVFRLLLTLLIRSLTWAAAPLATTEKLLLVLLPDGSVAVQLTVVVPMTRVLPEACEQLIVSWLDVLSE